MTTSEKRLSIIAGLIFLSYLLPFMLLPMVQDFYNDYQYSLESMLQQIERYEKLGERAEYWKTKNKKLKEENDAVELGLLPGTNQELLGTKMQALVKQLAKDVGINFKSLEPPDTSFSTGEWVLVIQSMQFEANGQTFLEFLRAVANNPVRLEITSLDVRSRKKKLSGTIKILGFSRVLPTDN